LIASEGKRCYGRAFRVTKEVLSHLDQREKNGYKRHDVSIQLPSTRVAGIVYIASQQNAAFLGDAPLEAIADQITKVLNREPQAVGDANAMAGFARQNSAAQFANTLMRHLVPSTDMS
jgi:cation transport regulator ChaC